ncbi:MAG TPA: TRAP transporter substrate-binding protein DctP, partial [Polyangia bacterium]|nr:TRAP transporter substrate-binding protein DctP [Polyangia bacterium]
MSRAPIAILAVTCALAFAGRADAEPRTLRFGTSAPDGTSWARSARQFGQEIEEATHGELHIKWYFGGVTGDERETLQHIRARQLDGEAAAGCSLLSSALRVTNIVGIFRSREEGIYILRKIRPTIDEEMRQNGFTDLGIASFGTDVIFSRTPIRSFADLQRGNYWVWDMYEITGTLLRAMGVHVKTTSLTDAGRAFERGQIDGFVAAPTAALAFQWTTQASYFTDLQVGFAPMCLVISNATMDQLPLDQQHALHAVGDRLVKMFDQTGATQDDALLHKLFEHQGLKRIPVDVDFRDEFYESARTARSTVDAKTVPP